MEQLFQILWNRSQEGKGSMLITIVEGKGSSPRSKGAHMIVGSQGRIYGTIGGGNLEYQSILKGQKLLEMRESQLQEYNLGAGGAAELGMVCGGQVKVLFYYVSAEDQDIQEFLSAGMQAEEKGEPYWLLLPLGYGKSQILLEKNEQEKSEIKLAISKIAAAKYRDIICLPDGKKYYAERCAYDGKVYFFGGGHLAQEAVPVLAHLGFTCVVLEDREEFLDRALFPQAEQLIKVDFKDPGRYIQVKQEDYICIMTRGHLCDMDAQRYAMDTPAGYIGVVGSKRKTQFVRETLKKDGYTDAQLDRIVTPIGLAIKAETPAEIAISIASQLIMVRAEKEK